MAFTAEQKRQTRKQDRQAALAGDQRAIAKRAAEKQRIERNFPTRSAQEEKRRRQHTRDDAEDPSDYMSNLRANVKLDKRRSGVQHGVQLSGSSIGPLTQAAHSHPR